jgi:hypothetical protein
VPIIKGYGVERYFQQYFSYIVLASFIGGGNRSTRKKNTDLPQVTDKLYHIMLYQVQKLEQIIIRKHELKI